MAQARYEYGTSPRKLDPQYDRRTSNKRLRVVENKPNKHIKVSAVQHKKTALVVASVILLLLTISCRNSQIDNQFSQIQKQKNELSSLQKENEQLKVSIENSLNLSNIEKIAKEELGMQKLSSKQIVYVTLPKKDYVESTTEKVIKEDKKQNWIQKIVNKFLNLK